MSHSITVFICNCFVCFALVYVRQHIKFTFSKRWIAVDRKWSKKLNPNNLAANPNRANQNKKSYIDVVQFHSFRPGGIRPSVCVAHIVATSRSRWTFCVEINLNGNKEHSWLLYWSDIVPYSCVVCCNVNEWMNEIHSLNDVRTFTLSEWKKNRWSGPTGPNGIHTQSNTLFVFTARANPKLFNFLFVARGIIAAFVCRKRYRNRGRESCGNDKQYAK